MYPKSLKYYMNYYILRQACYESCNSETYLGLFKCIYFVFIYLFCSNYQRCTDPSYKSFRIVLPGLSWQVLESLIMYHLHCMSFTGYLSLSVLISKSCLLHTKLYMVTVHYIWKNSCNIKNNIGIQDQRMTLHYLRFPKPDWQLTGITPSIFLHQLCGIDCL